MPFPVVIQSAFEKSNYLLFEIDTHTAGQELPDIGPECYFLNRADGKSIISLESKNMHEEMLSLNYIEDDNIEDQYIKTIHAWKKGDEETLTSLCDHRLHSGDKNNQKIFKIIIEDRNPGMANEIAEYITQQKGAFVVVDMFHLAEKKSIIQLLIDKGYDVQKLHIIDTKRYQLYEHKG